MRALSFCWQIVATVAEQNKFMTSLGAAIAENFAWGAADFAFANDLGFS